MITGYVPMQLELITGTVAAIPYLTIAPAGARARSVVFFICGYGGVKEHGLSLGYKLARAGFFVVSFDPWLHGERYDERQQRAAEPSLGGLYPPETGLDIGVTFYHVIERCKTDVETLLAHFAHDPRADVSRCGVTGLSMGGYASYLIFAHLRQMQAAVPMIGLANFARRWQDILDETACSNPAWGAALAQIGAPVEQHARYIAGLDPMAQLKAAAPRALLIMNCDFDADQPKLYALDTYRELLPHYTDQPEMLQLRIYPAGHSVTPEMEDDATAWFVRHLLE